MTVAYPSNITFAYDNVVFDADTITPSTEVPTMPAENLRLQERGAFWRTTGQDSETILLTLAGAKPFNLLALIDHNLSLNATVRVQANSADSWGSSPVDETFYVGADMAAAKGYVAPDGKVTQPAPFFLDIAQRVAGTGAVTFGADDAYSHADHADFKPTGAFTVGAWVKKDGIGTTNCRIFSSRNLVGSVNAGWTLGILAGSGRPYFESGKNTGITVGTHVGYMVGETMICDNQWHLVVGVWDGSAELKLYVDGKQDTTAYPWANAPAYAATNYVYIASGKNTVPADAYFLNGSLSDVFLHNGTALTDGQVADIYNNGITVTTNLKAWYKFASAALTTDSSGNSHTLTAVSVPVALAAGRPAEGLKVYQYIKLTFADSTNAAGYIQLGVLWLGEYLESERQYKYGATDEIVDPSTVSQSMGGQDWPDEEEMYLQLSFTIGRLSDEAKYFAFRQFFFAVRKTRFFLLLLQPGTALGRALMTAYGRFTENTKFSAAFYDDNDLTGLEFKEVR